MTVECLGKIHGIEGDNFILIIRDEAENFGVIK